MSFLQTRKKRAGREARTSRGFTLLEVAITVSILTSLTLGSLLVMVPVARQARLNREMEIANAESKGVLEKVQATPFNEILTFYPDGSSTPIATLQNGAVSVSYTDISADPLVMQVTVSWDSQDGGSHSRNFFTVRTE